MEPLAEAIMSGNYTHIEPIRGRREDDMKHVCVATRMGDSKRVVLKGPRENNNLFKDVILNEIEVMKNLPEPIHSRIPKMVRSKTRDIPFLEVEYIDGESFVEFLEGRPMYEQRISALVNICEIIEYLHISGFIHGDMKLGNIMHKDGEFYLIDFGGSGIQDEPTSYWHPHRNEYSAPELYYPCPMIMMASDIYSLSKLAIKVLDLGTDPADITERKAMQVLELMGCNDTEVYDIFRSSLSEEPFDRPPVFDLEDAIKNII